jgi:hypothetical protein
MSTFASAILQRPALYLRVWTARRVEHDVFIPDKKAAGVKPILLYAATSLSRPMWSRARLRLK